MCRRVQSQAESEPSRIVKLLVKTRPSGGGSLRYFIRMQRRLGRYHSTACMLRRHIDGRVKVKGVPWKLGKPDVS
ncbi:hypothetical protein RRG08_021483 [Elysia crispata]|uniref:Uncharacterized protein n=1 Tax=Elysia crispata TaxID=231223 RepID=A0AAE1BBX6_9GAST|nr:hypothetical protein RRG08_021483 [Elysia crispata]